MDDQDLFLRFLSLKSLEEKGFSSNQEYLDRLEEELEIIADMGFSCYFLVEHDFVMWAKNNGIPVGPGRGSGAGSLIAYLVGITDVDPIKYGLIFSRQ